MPKSAITETFLSRILKKKTKKREYSNTLYIFVPKKDKNIHFLKPHVYEKYAKKISLKAFAFSTSRVFHTSPSPRG